MSGISKPSGMPWSSFLGVVAMAASLVAGYVTLQNNVAANADDVAEIERRIDRLENRAGDVRERLKAIEVVQKQQNETLTRILRAVER